MITHTPPVASNLPIYKKVNLVARQWLTNSFIHAVIHYYHQPPGITLQGVHAAWVSI